MDSKVSDNVVNLINETTEKLKDKKLSKTIADIYGIPIIMGLLFPGSSYYLYKKIKEKNDLQKTKEKHYQAAILSQDALIRKMQHDADINKDKQEELNELLIRLTKVIKDLKTELESYK